MCIRDSARVAAEGAEMTRNMAAHLVQSFAGLIVQLHQRYPAARVGGAQHISSGQISLGHNQHRLHILVDSGGGQLI